MNILVTGGAGFIGSHLVDKLLQEQDHTVIVIDDLSTGRYEYLSQHCNNPRFKFIRGSITDAYLLARTFQQNGIKLIYHLAAVVGVHHVLNDPHFMLMSNIHGTEMILQHAYTAQARVVFASSSEVYGKTHEQIPLCEDSDRILGPTTVPRWAYSTSKVVGEYSVHAYDALGLLTTIIRYCNVFGRRMDAQGYGSVIAKFVTQAQSGVPLTVYGDGDQTRCFIHVDDAVNGTLLAGTHPQAVGGIFNIANPVPIEIRQLASRVVELCKSNSEIRHVDPPYVNFEEPKNRMPNISRAFEVLGFQPRVSLDAGLRMLI